MFNLYRSCLVACALIALIGRSASAYQDSDLETKAKAEVEKYDRMTEDLRKSVESWAEVAKDRARKAGKADSVLEVQKQVEKYNRYGVLPDSPKLAAIHDPQSLLMLGSRTWKLFGNVEKAYKEAIQDFTKSGKQADAERLQADFDKFFEKHDPFANGSTWTGKVISRTGDTTVKPLEMAATVYITRRDKDSFDVRTEHHDHREWQFTFTLGSQGYKVTKAELTKLPNPNSVPNLAKLLGTREVLGSELKYNGAVWEFSLIRAERKDKPTLNYVLSRSP